MGPVKVTIAVGDPQGQMFEDLEVTVDTGSTFTTVPRELLRRLGVPVTAAVETSLADVWGWPPRSVDGSGVWPVGGGFPFGERGPG